MKNIFFYKKRTIEIKSLLLFVLMLFWFIPLTAQNVNIQFFPEKINHNRAEIVIPNVNGFEVLKADLHIHTIFSDGNVWPSFRVQEAWREGLDVISITDHLEYLPHKDYLNADFNTSCNIAAPEAEKLGMIFIRGAEITRKQGVIGHFNAIFIKDANLLKVDDPKEAIKAAKAQGAFVTFNHPAWKMDTCKFSSFQKEVMEEGLIDGIEVINNHEYYARALSWCHDLHKTIISASDAHDPVADQFKLTKAGLENIRYRPMTLIFVKERSEKGVREALDSRRTLGYFDGRIVGDKELLGALFNASVKFNKVSANNKTDYYMLKNNSGFPYRIRIGSLGYLILPMSTISLSFPKTTKSVEIEVISMYYYENLSPKFTISLE